MKTATALASPTELANDLKRTSTRPASVELTPRSTETVNCYLCGSSERTELLLAEDDLTGRSGRFRFVTCAQCGLAYQNPRLTLESRGRVLRRQLHRASEETRLGPPDADLQPRDGEARPRQGPSRGALLPADTSDGGPRRRMRIRFLPSAAAPPLRRSGDRSGFQGPVVEPVPPGNRVPSRSLLRRRLPERPVRRRDDVALPRARLRSAAQPPHGAGPAATRRAIGRRGPAARQPHVRLVRQIAGPGCRRRSTRCSSIGRTS